MLNHADDSCALSVECKGFRSFFCNSTCKYFDTRLCFFIYFQMTDLIQTTSNDDANITIELDTLIEEVRLCVEKCRLYSKILGMGKLERKFRAEDRFLQRVSVLFREKSIKMTDCSLTMFAYLSDKSSERHRKKYSLSSLRGRDCLSFCFSFVLEQTMSMQII